jgi:K+ transporter
MACCTATSARIVVDDQARPALCRRDHRAQSTPGLSPTYGVSYFVRHGWHGLPILGVVVLCFTGGEALYADMGHFGARPIRLAWFVLAMPCLVLCYFGQGALMLTDASTLANPFFSLVPTGIALYALVVLATAATIIASQALISGVFSLTNQAMTLGFFPRVTIRHTSDETEGQIYVPELNWSLMIGAMLLVVFFKESSKLAAAFGIAVSGTMAITSVTYYLVTRQTWGWPIWKALPFLGSALFVVVFAHVPFVADTERLDVERLDKGFIRVTAHYGFMQQPVVPDLLAQAKLAYDLPQLDLAEATYFLGRETFLATARGEMGPLREGIFAFLSRNARSATTYFSIPPAQVVEIGAQIDL